MRHRAENSGAKTIMAPSAEASSRSFAPTLFRPGGKTGICPEMQNERRKNERRRGRRREEEYGAPVSFKPKHPRRFSEAGEPFRTPGKGGEPAFVSGKTLMGCGNDSSMQPIKFFEEKLSSKSNNKLFALIQAKYGERWKAQEPAAAAPAN